jgi:hypothetical protein
MPGVPARPPGWRRRGCRRRSRTGHIARSRRPAIRRPHQAGPGRCRHGGLLRPALRTGASCFAGRRRCARARPASPAPVQRVRSETEEHLAGKVLSRECRGVSSLTSSKMSTSRASSSSRIWRAVTVSSGVGRFLAGTSRRQGSTTGRRAAYQRMPAAGRCSAVTLPARHVASLPYELPAPRGALSYPRFSREELGRRFLGLMAYSRSER